MTESFHEGNCVLVPSTKSLYHEGLEMNSLSAAVVEMSPNFRPLPHFDGGAGRFGGAKYDGVLGRRHNANVEGDQGCTAVGDGRASLTTKMYKFAVFYHQNVQI